MKSLNKGQINDLHKLHKKFKKKAAKIAGHKLDILTVANAPSEEGNTMFLVSDITDLKYMLFLASHAHQQLSSVVMSAMVEGALKQANPTKH